MKAFSSCRWSGYPFLHGYFTLSVTSLRLPYTILVRLQIYKTNAIILTPEIADSLSIWFSIRGCCPVCATGDSLPCGCYWLAPLSGNKESLEPKATRFRTNILYTPNDNTYLHVYHANAVLPNVSQLHQFCWSLSRCSSLMNVHVNTPKMG